MHVMSCSCILSRMPGKRCTTMLQLSSSPSSSSSREDQCLFCPVKSGQQWTIFIVLRFAWRWTSWTSVHKPPYGPKVLDGGWALLEIVLQYSIIWYGRFYALWRVDAIQSYLSYVTLSGSVLVKCHVDHPNPWTIEDKVRHTQRQNCLCYRIIKIMI